ncbi:maleylacetoacetate isomerase [Psychrobacter sp. YP14]|uniref:Maleylacetoacetate isomerase n=2 Tax=Psychrobacter TaxID=497 RepID=A0A844M0C2_9GAMM|nr:MULTISPECIES: maleylacetoacetate isomerase [Psychrobacter]AWT48720.1 maleylacetoacetate isomerase [Psychrobacter sp. YP14]MUG32068.1 maleylacetoacetate isomerase [Psychrobacter sanguinis]
MKLYNFFRSGTSHRTRIVLNLKGLDYDYVAVSLAKEEHLQPAFKALNPQGLVPVLQTDDTLLFQSPAIIEWLEEQYPDPALLPKDPFERAHVRALAAMVGCDIHPINNRRILQYLRNELHQDEEAVLTWCKQWINDGFTALEQILSEDKSRQGFCFGDTPTIADAYLIPQIESAKRFEVDLTPYPLIREVEANCMQLPAFIDAAPFKQPDAPAKV